MVRYVAMGLALIASLGQLLPIALLALLVPSCIYLARFRILWPVAFLLIPPIVATFVVFYPFWVLAMVSNSYLRSVNGIKGVVEEEGVRLNGRRLPNGRWLPWAEIRSIRWRPTPPLGSHYLFDLRDGSEVRVDFLPFDLPSEACEQVRCRLTDD